MQEIWLAQEGCVTLAAGQRRADVKLIVLNDPLWTPEAVSTIKILEPDKNESWVRGDVYFATIVTLNQDIFPSNVPKDAPPSKTIIGFIKQNYSLLPHATKLGLAYRTYGAVYFIISDIIRLLLLEVVFRRPSNAKDSKLPEPSELFRPITGTTEYHTAMLWGLACIYIANFALNHFFDRQFLRLKLGGKARNRLRRAVMEIILQVKCCPKVCIQ